jgi:hypothetical protein
VKKRPVPAGGTVGLGARERYSDDSIELVGTDVYAETPFMQ